MYRAQHKSGDKEGLRTRSSGARHAAPGLPGLCLPARIPFYPLLILPLLILLAVIPFAGSSGAQAAASPSFTTAADAAIIVPARTPGYIITVAPGDTLSGLSRARYGTASYWPVLAWVNHLGDPDVIIAGERLLFPWRPAGVKVPNHVGAAQASYNLQSISVAGSGGFPSYGVYSFSMLVRIWEWAGGPGWAADRAARIAGCESGGRTWAKNPSSPASGLWQIDGLPFPGNPFDGPTNARMAVWKFSHAGDSFAPWVCQLRGGHVGPVAADLTGRRHEPRCVGQGPGVVSHIDVRAAEVCAVAHHEPGQPGVCTSVMLVKLPGCGAQRRQLQQVDHGSLLGRQRFLPFPVLACLHGQHPQAPHE